VIELRRDQFVWKQVAEIIRSRIRDGSYPPLHQLPSETAIMGEFEIGRSTARKVIAALRDEGLIYTVPQIGSFVTPPGGPPE
jgi:GntR family transcriptional regulator